MTTNPHYQAFYQMLEHLGTISHPARSRIEQAIQKIHLKPQESITRHLGELGYIATGVLKEYDVRQRRRPVIINFMGAGDVFDNTPFTMRQYFKAIMPTELWLFSKRALGDIYQNHQELLDIYEKLTGAYHEQLFYRSFILDKRTAQARMDLFNNHFKSLLPYLSLRDIANYIAVSYDHLIRSI